MSPRRLSLSDDRVLNEKRKPIGYLDVKAIKQKFEQGAAESEDELCE